MIKPADIRDGIVLYSCFGRKDVPILAGRELLILYGNRGIEWINEEYKAIPLTPEWLERCGFTWDEENQVYSIQIGNALYLEYDKDFDCAINPESWPGGSTYVWGENKTVHQLQNLYLALTGEELEIKMP